MEEGEQAALGDGADTKHEAAGHVHENSPQPDELAERHRREREHRKGCDGEEAGFSFGCAEFQMPVGITHDCKCLMHSETRASRGQGRA